MMGTLVHVQLYTFSYRKHVIRPQNMPKTADWGVCVGIFITDCIQMTGITKSFLEIILRHQFRLEGSQQLGIWR